MKTADWTLKAFAGLMVLLVLSYGWLAGAGFVFDDYPLVVNNTLIRDLGNLPEFFRTDLWAGADIQGGSGYFRPLVITSFAVDYALFGGWAGGYHLQSLAWHLLATGLLFVWLRKVLPPVGALLATALFALHPLQSEAVAWIAARNDVMVAAFSMGVLLMLEGERPSVGRLVAAGGFAFGALLSKESAVLVPLLVVGGELAFHRRFSHWSKFLAMGLPLAAYLLLRSQADLSSEQVPTLDYALAALKVAPTLAGHYGMKVLSPYPLSVGASLEYLHPWVAVASLAVVGVSALLLWKGRAQALYGLGWTFLVFAPPLLAISFRTQLGERYMYLPMAGLGIALASVVPSDRRGGWVVLGLTALYLAIVPARLMDWKDNEALWGAAVASDPNGYSYSGLAHVYVEQGRIEEAAYFMHIALEQEPPATPYCANAVRLGLNHNRLDLAYRGAWLVGQNCPDTPDLLGLVGVARMMAGDVPGAQSVLHRWDGRPDEHLDILAAAMAHYQGDAEAAAPYEARAEDPADFSRRVEDLVLNCESNLDREAFRAALREPLFPEDPP